MYLATTLLAGVVSLSWSASLANYGGLILDTSRTETISQRFPVPDGFTRAPVKPGTFAEWLGGLTLLPDSIPATDWRDHQVFTPEEVGGVLNWRLLGAEEQCADIALRLLAEHAWEQPSGQTPWFRSLSGHEIRWDKWLAGRYATNEAQTAIIHASGLPRDPSRDEFEKFLSFVMTYTNTASMSRDWPEIGEAELSIGDVIIQPHCTGRGMGHLSLVVDACIDENGSRLFMFIDGYTPARMPVVRQKVTGRRESVWMTPQEYLQLQQQFGPGKFHRFPGW